MRVKPQEGLEVIATGKLTTYPGSSKYQIVIEAIEPAGIGALMALMEERKKKLAAEGLFDEARKQLLPWLPEVIGVVTSPTGAVIRDILHRLEDRFPRRVLVWPVKVQGDGSGATGRQRIAGDPPPTAGQRGRVPAARIESQHQRASSPFLACQRRLDVAGAARPGRARQPAPDRIRRAHQAFRPRPVPHAARALCWP